MSIYCGVCPFTVHLTNRKKNLGNQTNFQICLFLLNRQIQDPASQRLTWYKPPLAVLVIKKVRDQAVLPPFVQLVSWLIQV